MYGDGPQAKEIEERVRSGLKRLVWTLGATTPTSMRGAYPTCAKRAHVCVCGGVNKGGGEEG